MALRGSVGDRYGTGQGSARLFKLDTVTRIACCRFSPVLGEIAANVDKTVELVTAAAHAGAEIVVLPELANSGYAFENPAEAAAVAEDLSGPTVATWRELAARLNIVLIAGFCEANPAGFGGADGAEPAEPADPATVGDRAILADRATAGAPYNSCVVLVPGREPVVYRKVHLWDHENLVFAPGSDEPALVDTRHGRIAAMICYDLEFPEWVRNAALRGADLICAPVNWPLGEAPAGERPGELVRVQAQASMNRVAIAACSRGGDESGIAWLTESIIVDANGWPVAIDDAGGDTPSRIQADIDLSQSRNKRIAENSDVFTDRRPDLYHKFNPDRIPSPTESE